MGPSVRNLINQYELDPSQIESSGPHQTLLKSDVLGYLNQRSNPKATTNVAAAEMRAHATLSAAKPSMPSSSAAIGGHRPHQAASISDLAKTKYARRRLEPLEIEVINSGGLIEIQQAEKPVQKRR